MRDSIIGEKKKHLFFWVFSVVLFCCFCSTSSFIINGTEIDRRALIDFKAKLIDPLGVMNSWNDTTHLCLWYGVTCGRRHQRVTVLNLKSSRLVGPISPSIGNMSFLKDLGLRNNSLNGELPHQIGRLRRLRKIVLNNNSIGGVIPSNISSCSKLVSIDLQYNHFVGKIPIELGFLSDLQFLNVNANNFTGIIPHFLGNLTFLSLLRLRLNNLVGRIPDTFGKLGNLNDLDVSVNQLSGAFPLSILNLSSISSLGLGLNQFNGTLPSNLGIALPNLEFFGISGNSFNGMIPSSIANVSSLVQLNLDTNKFIGQMPSLGKLDRLIRVSISGNFLGYGGNGDLSFVSSLFNATKLEALAMSNNNFGGVLPGTIGNLSSKLTVFYINGNKISGHIPTQIENLVGLQDFQAHKNRLSGYIPKNIGKLQYLRMLALRENMLSGTIPLSIGNLTRVIVMDLSLNNFQGRIPKTLGQCQILIGLDLGGNNLSGEIPTQVLELSSLSIVFSVYKNQLSGSLPWQVGNLKTLNILDISENMLSGKIPSSLRSCISLDTLYMQGNLFQGPIPPSLSSLRGLRVLDLSRNNFSGEIPEYFVSFQLQLLNLSNNNLQGKVPTGGIFKNASVVSIFGNSKLCGGISELKLPMCNFEMSKQMHPWRLMIVILCGFLGLILLSFLISVIWCRKKKKGLANPSQTVLANFLLDLSYNSLVKATDGFSAENLIGTGSFGSVYKGTFDESGTIIAVKVMNLQRRGAFKSFAVECEALRNIRHRNLVKVLSVCSSIDNHGNDFKALVYEFMANGSLEDWLHPSIEINECAPPRHLNFSQRLNISVDVAFALDYLHHHCGSVIVHCDLKPSNILLDGDLIAHVGDFGLAKFLSQSTIDIATTQSSSIGVRGTIGYASPEYGMANEVSTYGDVYSFGILLLEMFTGKRPTDNIFKEGLNLHRYCKEVIPERLIEILDPTLAQEVIEAETRATRLLGRRGRSNGRVGDSLASLFALGTSCSAELPKDRLVITEVASKLCVIRNQFSNWLS